MRKTKWAAKIIPNPRQEREYIERDNKQNVDDRTKKIKQSGNKKQIVEGSNLNSFIDSDIFNLIDYIL